MFNFIAAAALNYILVSLLRPTGSMDPASARFPAETNICPALSEILASVGILWGRNTPANVTFLVARCGLRAGLGC